MEAKLSEIKPNPDNPRTITDDMMDKLVQSIEEFPEMLKLRPIVVNDGMMILGGNQRLEACKRAGLKTVPILKASDLTEEQQKEFIVKDNANFGNWQFETLLEDWDIKLLDHWGINTPFLGSEINDLEEKDLDLDEEFDPLGVSKGYQRVVFIFETKTEAEDYLKKNNIKHKKRANAWQVNMTSQSI